MLYELSKDLQALLAAKKYPVKVRFGPERVMRDKYREGHAIVIEHDPDAGDRLLAPPGAKHHSRMLRARVLGAKATIYARSSLPNAHRGDHERECEKIVDALTCAMYKWGAEAKVGDLPVSKMGFLAAPPDGPEVWPGVVYEIRFGVPRGVYDRDYVGEQNAGAAGPTGAATAVGNTTVATVPGVAPATGCDST
jgi:hypothetical protein